MTIDRRTERKNSAIAAQAPKRGQRSELLRVGPTNRKNHWNHVYQTRAPADVSWYQARPASSLKFIEACGVRKDQAIIDVGGGTSLLVDFLLDAGYQRLAVLDISAAALEQARQRLGGRAHAVEWFEADVAEFNPPHRFAVWHDRALFHFLTEKADRRKYVDTLTRALSADDHAVIATFAIDGPERCSGLAVARYDSPAISAELGVEFRMLEETDETHITPWGAEQKFSYFHFARNATPLP
jgi:SAM-dependent methyltransferase